MAQSLAPDGDEWVLEEPLASKRLGEPICFRMHTAIGPCTSK